MRSLAHASYWLIAIAVIAVAALLVAAIPLLGLPVSIANGIEFFVQTMAVTIVLAFLWRTAEERRWRVVRQVAQRNIVAVAHYLATGFYPSAFVETGKRADEVGKELADAADVLRRQADTISQAQMSDYWEMDVSGVPLVLLSMSHFGGRLRDRQALRQLMDVDLRRLLEDRKDPHLATLVLELEATVADMLAAISKTDERVGHYTKVVEGGGSYDRISDHIHELLRAESVSEEARQHLDFILMALSIEGRGMRDVLLSLREIVVAVGEQR